MAIVTVIDNAWYKDFVPDPTFRVQAERTSKWMRSYNIKGHQLNLANTVGGDIFMPNVSYCFYEEEVEVIHE